MVVRVGHSLGLAVHRVYILEFFAIPSTQPAAVSYCNRFPHKSVQSLARLPVMWMVRVRFREWAHCHITCNLFFARLIASYFYAGSETGHYQKLAAQRCTLFKRNDLLNAFHGDAVLHHSVSLDTISPEGLYACKYHAISVPTCLLCI